MATHYQLLFTTPISRLPLYGGGTISGVNFLKVFVDPLALTCTVIVSAIEDGDSSTIRQAFTVPITGATTYAQTLAALKTAIAAAWGASFQ